MIIHVSNEFKEFFPKCGESQFLKEIDVDPDFDLVEKEFISSYVNVSMENEFVESEDIELSVLKDGSLIICSYEDFDEENKALITLNKSHLKNLRKLLDIMGITAE